MNIILFDQKKNRDFLKPLTLTRPISELRCGIMTIREKWEKLVGFSCSSLSESYLSEKFPVNYTNDNLYINASYLPEQKFLTELKALESNTGLFHADELVAYRAPAQLVYDFELPLEVEKQQVNFAVHYVKELPHLFLNNNEQIVSDYEILTSGKETEDISDPFTRVYKPERVFVGKNVSIKAAIINAENGPVFIDDNAVILEGAILVGPVAVGANSMVGYGAKIRENTTIGPDCRVSGEVKNTIFHAHTNKAHDGFIGNSYLGEWCNLGANTNSSNLKNNYKPVSLYSYSTEDYYETGEVFCGTFMGDYSKAGISTMFNTGSVVGVSSNVFGAGFQAKNIPSFSWGGSSEGYTHYRFDKAVEVINATMQRRGLSLSQIDLMILKFVSDNKVK